MSTETRTALRGGSHLGIIFALVRVVSLLASLAVTRALDPGVFTILAIAMMVFGLTERLTVVNMLSHLTRAKSIEPIDYQVAFSCELVRGAILATIICLVGFGVQFWGSDQRVGIAISILSLSFVINGMRNPRIVDLRRDGKYFLYGLCEFSPALGFAGFSVLLVTLDPSYTSLIWSAVLSNLVGVVVGYVIIPWRPKFCIKWEVARPMVNLGVVLFVGGLAVYGRDQFAIMLLTFQGAGDNIGIFNRAAAFSWVIGIQVVGLQWKVLLPLFAKSYHSGASVVRMVNRFQGIIFLASLVGAAIAIQFGDQIVTTLLSEKWSGVTLFWTPLACAAGIALSSAPLEANFQAEHREKEAVKIYLCSLGVHIVAMLLLFHLYGYKGIGLAYVVSQTFQALTFRLCWRPNRAAVAKNTQNEAGNS